MALFQLPQDSCTEPLHLDQNTDSSTSGFLIYQSPLSWYPLLRSLSRPYSLDQATTLSQAGVNGTAYHLMTSHDLQPLKVAVSSKFLSDPLRRVCQYEVPGGGECRDQDCEDIHLSRLTAVEPTGTQSLHFVTVAYLFIFSPFVHVPFLSAEPHFWISTFVHFCR